jgi:flagellin
MSNIVLSNGIRNNLIALQQNSADQTIVNNRLATGKSVNSALDNPLKYFTAQNFDSQSNNLSAILDNIGLGLNTISQANQGITSISQIIQTQQALLKQALQTPPTNANISSGSILTGPQAGQLKPFGLDSTGIYYPPLINTANTGWPVQTNPFPNATTLTIAPTTATGAPVIASFAISFAPIAQAVGPANFTSYDLVNAINNAASNQDPARLGQTYVKASIDSGGRLIIDNVAGGSLSLTLGAAGTNTLQDLFGRLPDYITTSAAYIGSSGTTSGVLASTVNITRQSAANTYNGILQQITNLAKDSGFNGTNLLYGQALSVTLNDTATTKLNITGVTYDAVGLNLTPTDTIYKFQSDTEINLALTNLQGALTSLNSEAANLAQNNAILTTRRQFTSSTINTLKGGTALLITADANEEGANLLALQTRQQLSVQSLSLANQSDRSVLKLFN